MSSDVWSEEAEGLAGEVARLTGETKTEAVNQALRERIERVHRAGVKGQLADELNQIALHCSALPVLDRRGVDDTVGYDEQGLPC